MGVGYLACSFDLLNVEHLDVIAQARSRCTDLVVGVFSDEQVYERSGRPSIVPLQERVALVKHVRGVHDVIVHGSAQYRALAPESVFVMAGDPANDLDDVTALVSERQTTSVGLLGALRQPVRTAVA